MYPVYRDMNSYPYQTPSPQFYNPSWEAFPPQMKEDDRANTRQMHEYWPHNYGYPAPMPCQNCCAHGQHTPYYNFRPPCPHFQLPLGPPPYGHYYGGYPASYLQPYPYVPPPHYSMEMPRYEYDKSSPKAFHCCECPNHPSQVKSTNNVKIEEQDPDVETRKAESLVPARSSNSPYPILWMPPEYMMNKEQNAASPYFEKPGVQLSPHESEVKPKTSIQAVEQDPNGRYQWFPLDMDSIRRRMEGGKGDQENNDGVKKAVDVERNDQNKQFSYPIIWMPYGGQGENHISGQDERNIADAPTSELEGRNNAKKAVEEHPSTFKVVKHPGKELLKDANEAGTRGSHKTGNVKIIPVKQLDDPIPKSLKKEQAGEVNESSKMVNRESSKNCTDMKPSSPAKKCKLPPICLRVDPPRKKNGKGSSRSPSPPGEKKLQKSVDSKEEGKDKELQRSKEEIQVKEVVVGDPNGNDVVISRGLKEEEKGSCTLEHQSEVEGKVLQDADSNKLDGSKCGSDGIHALEPQEVKESKHEESGVPVKKISSETEAAVTIQSAYRGYAVRRWEPLKKFRQIANIREEASKIKGQIDKLESCVSVDDKEKVAIGETIMNLLLKLDAIQGLHPSIRYVRRSVAKELSLLQEKLDCILSQKSTPTGPYSSITAGVKEHSNAFGSDEDSAKPFEVSEQGVAFDGDKSVETQNEREGTSFSEDPDVCCTGNEEANKIREELARATKNEEVMSSIGSSLDYEKELDETMTPTEASSMESEDPLVADTRPLEDTPVQVDIVSHDKDQEANVRAELPQEIVEEQVENDICRMDWECDLGAAKIIRGIDQEATQLAEFSQELVEHAVNISDPCEKFDSDAESAFEVEKGEEKQAESHAEVIKENEGDKDEVADQTSGKSEVQCDDCVETFDEKNPDAQEPETTNDPKCMETPILEQDDRVSEKPAAEETPFIVPVTEVEKDVIKGQETREESVSDTGIDQMNRRIIEENEKLRSMVEKLVASGKEQQDVISSLTSKVQDLEKKLPKRNKTRSGKGKRPGVIVPRRRSLNWSSSIKK